jgi:SpoIID/LytB domain protein
VRPVQPILHARFKGKIEMGKDEHGALFVIGVVSLEDYLGGIAEVPRLWPFEALKAQVVAARSYALARIGNPDPTGIALGYQLCSTDACQVYRGLGIAEGPYGNRWVAAVNATRAQVLLSGGRPADALYFSTSNGHTVGNEQVFGSAPLPYLRPVTELDDGGSPVSHWRATLPLTDVATFLRRAGDWSSAGAVTSVSTAGSTVTVRGVGTSKALSASEFRNDLNAWAYCLDPDRYPSINGVNGTALPQTVPSVWFTATTGGGSAVLTGRGWGHGVGMVQWGAEGKAARGMTYRDILAFYYGGLRPVAHPEPAEIRVGIAVGLRSVTVAGVGPVTLQNDSAGPGPWLVTGGPLLQIQPDAPAPPSNVSAGLLSSPSTGRSGRVLSATLDLPQLSVVSLVLSSGGVDHRVTKPVTLQPGGVKLSGVVPPITTGTYTIQAVVSDGIDVVRTPARDIRIAGLAPTLSQGPTSSPPPAPRAAVPASSGGRGTTTLVFLVAGIAVPLALAAGLLLRRRRSPHA